jgi:hypothetical protein
VGVAGRRGRASGASAGSCASRPCVHALLGGRGLAQFGDELPSISLQCCDKARNGVAVCTHIHIVFQLDAP